MKTFVVEEADSDIRLDRWMKRHLPHINHSMLEKGLRKGWVKLDGKKTTASTRVKAGQQIGIAESLVGMTASARPKPKPVVGKEEVRWLKDAILYEDSEMIALNKPPGIAVQGGTGQRMSVDDLTASLVERGEQKPRLVHRLDKDTSGVLLLAKNAKSAHKLTSMFAGKEIEKTYLALVIGVPKPREGRIDLPVAKQEGRGGAEKMEVDEDFGKRAITEYQVLESFGKELAWVELKPVTGRTHQLRVHMAAIGHPIVGDGKYGGAKAFVRGGDISEQLHLHAAKIALPGKRTLEAPLPKHMEESKKILG